MLLELLLAFTLSVGLFLIIWCLTGLLLLPVFGENMVSLCLAKGSGGELEQQVRAFGWLRDGSAKGAELIIVDCGLDLEGKNTADILQRKYPWVRCCSREMLEDWLNMREDIV